MRSLGFAAAPIDGPRKKQVRTARFEARSALPVSAACVVANGVRETLSSLFGAAVGIRLFEPSIPSPQAWTVICENARLYRFHGSVADAAIVLRPPDAVALAAALFGEPHPCAVRVLSPIECDVLDRMIGAIAANLGAVCGKREGGAIERVGAIAGFVTYFEVSIEEPVRAGIGVALSRDPAPEPGAALDIRHLGAIRINAGVTLDLGTAQAAAVAGIGIGTTLTIAQAAFHTCELAVHRRRIAIGRCGVQNGYYALVVDAA